jgi:protein associated with RNAse G/E
MSETVVVIKLDAQRREAWRYAGRILRRWPEAVLLEAHFNRDDLDFHGIPFKRGDRFLEMYYADRWYNIYELHDREDDQLKGWYCNVCLPAEFKDGQVTYVDLALDLLVYPDGRQLVLDEDEFAELKLDGKTGSQARAALEELKRIFTPPVNLRLGEWE